MDKVMIKFTKHFLKKMEDLLSELGFILRYEKGNFQSGYCMVEHRNIIVVNKFFDTQNRIQVLLELIQQLQQLKEDSLTSKNKLLLQHIKSGNVAHLSSEEPEHSPSEESLS
jgi:hypothetical protein